MGWHSLCLHTPVPGSALLPRDQSRGGRVLSSFPLGMMGASAVSGLSQPAHFFSHALGISCSCSLNTPHPGASARVCMPPSFWNCLPSLSRLKFFLPSEST